ncbi:hypothetical protein WN944_026416 [Citrus x changshan-huyou]|uniref:Uncharacterized protein n=1 Tax=Citrus x changshan-huyou TaxID=2935761 RepID=A0AAP0LV21_9ROSI
MRENKGSVYHATWARYPPFSSCSDVALGWKRTRSCRCEEATLQVKETGSAGHRTGTVDVANFMFKETRNVGFDKNNKVSQNKYK